MLVDANGTEIRASGFKTACDKFYDMLEVAKVLHDTASYKLNVLVLLQCYIIRSPQVRYATKSFGIIKAGDKELILSTETEIDAVEDDPLIPVRRSRLNPEPIFHPRRCASIGKSLQLQKNCNS